MSMSLGTIKKIERENIIEYTALKDVVLASILSVHEMVYHLYVLTLQ